MDYKQASAAGLQIGAASILATYGDFEERAGGAEGLYAAMRAKAADRGVDVLVAMSQVDKATGLRGLGYVAAPDAKAGAADAFAAVERGLEAAPASLPEDLRTASLFVQQDIVGAGFGVAFADRGGLRHTAVRAATSRKTLLPTILHFSEA